MMIRTNSAKREAHSKKEIRNFKNNDKDLQVTKVAEEYIRIVKDHKLSKLNDVSVSNSI